MATNTGRPRWALRTSAALTLGFLGSVAGTSAQAAPPAATTPPGDEIAHTVQEGDTLWSACDRLLGGDWREVRDDVVVSLSARQVQTFIALVVAGSFIYDVEHAEAAVDTGTAEPEAPAADLVSVAAAETAQPEDAA